MSFKQKLAIFLMLEMCVVLVNKEVRAQNQPSQLEPLDRDFLNASSPTSIAPVLKGVSVSKTPFSAQETILSQVPNPSQIPEQSTPFLLPSQSPEPIPLPETPTEPAIDVLETPVFPSPEGLPEDPGTITVTQFEFEGNTAFSDEALAEATAAFRNRPITFVELLQAEAAVTELYVEAGYINSGAVIPADQTLSPQDATIVIQVIEGSVEEINVQVEGRLSEEYVRSRLALGTDTPLNQKRLLEALQLLQLNPRIQTITAELSAGAQPELSVLNVQVTEADTFSMGLLLDNGRIPSVGSFRRGIQLEHLNLLGFGDTFYGEYFNTDGSNVFNLRYQIPLNARDGTLALAGGLTDSLIIEEPFDVLEIRGNSPYFELSYRQPVIRKPSHELALGITAARQESGSQLLGVNFPLSPGAEPDGRTHISAIRLFQEFTQRSPRSVLALRSQFNIGVDAFEATVNSEPPDSRFFDWRGQGQYVRLLAPDFLLLLRSELQLASTPLVPLEQFALGGINSVRGYRQDQFLTDNGFFASAEVRIPLVRADVGVLQLAPFIDFGIAWNNEDNLIPTPTDNTLLGVGVGIQWQMDDMLSARFDWGIPLTGPEQGGDTLQEQGLYFSLNYNFF